jgi:hypothetical protein
MKEQFIGQDARYLCNLLNTILAVDGWTTLDEKAKILEAMGVIESIVIAKRSCIPSDFSLDYKFIIATGPWPKKQ